jgi:hypothetical protein
VTAVATERVARGATLGAAALSTGAPWLWVVALGVTPAPDALEHLLEVAGGPDAPALVAALAVDRSGRPLPRLVPRGGQADLEAMIAAAPLHRLPLRQAPGGCVLVRRAAVESHGVPDESLGPFAFAEWSQRALRDAPGWLVPAARAVADGVPAASWRDAPRALQAARRARWSAGDTLRALGDAYGRAR